MLGYDIKKIGEETSNVRILNILSVDPFDTGNNVKHRSA